MQIVIYSKRCLQLWKSTQPAYKLCTTLAIDFSMFLPIVYILTF